MASGAGSSMQKLSVQKALLADPALFLDEEQRDLSSWAAERQDADLGPDGERFLEAWFS